VSNFVKILHLGLDLFRADGQKGGHTDITKLMVAFRSFSKAPKNVTRNLVTIATYEVIN